MSIAVVLGVGIIAAIIFYITFQINDKKHVGLQLFLLGVGFLLLLLMAKVTLDNAQVCEFTLDQTVLNTTTNTTTYTHTLQCVENNDATPKTIYTIMLWVIRLFYAYVIVYFIIELMTYLSEMK